MRTFNEMMSFLIQIHLFYTDDAHFSVIQNGHILLRLRLLPVVGPLDEFYAKAIQELAGSLLS